MKITRKMSPVLFGLVAVLVGMSMMGAAISVIVSNSAQSNEVNITNPASVTIASPVDADLSATGDLVTNHPTADLGQNYPGLENFANNINPAVGTIYDTMVRVTCSAELNNLVLTIRITDSDGQAVKATDVSLKECFVTDVVSGTGAITPNPMLPTVNWVPIHLESYGDYLLGKVQNQLNGFHVVPQDDSTPFIFDLYYVVTFAAPGDYTISWEATSQDGVTPVA